MKQRSITLAALVAFAMAGKVSAAATVTYSYYTATGSADTSWINVAGATSIVAANVGSTATTFGGVTWGAMVSGNMETTANGITINYSAPNKSWASTYGNYYAGGPLLLNNGGNSGTLQSGGVDYLLTFSGLTVGQDYLIQLVLADTRADNGYSTILAKSGVTGDSARTRYSYMDGQYEVITASFTADATSVAFQPAQSWGDVAPTQTAVNAVQVLAVPEPSAALLGGLGMLGMLRRRRR